MIEIHGIEADGSLLPFADRVMCFPAGEQHIAETAAGRESLTPAVLAVVRGTHHEDYVLAGMAIDLAHQRGQRAIFAVPYLPGARQDRGRPFGAKVYANLINALDADQVICLDPHSPVMPSMIQNLTAIDSTQVVVDALATTRPADDLVGVICPDQGAVERSATVAAALDLPVYQARKHRDFVTGRLSGFTCEPLPEAGTLLVVDDICDGGGTFRGLAAATGLPRNRLVLFVSHGVFSGTAPSLRESYDQILTTDSHPGSARKGVATDVIPVMPYLLAAASGRATAAVA